MKYVGAIIAVALASLAVVGIAIFSFLPKSGTGSPAAATQEPGELAAVAPDSSAIQAAFAAREALIQAQIQQLDGELVDRKADYDARVVELTDLIATGETQLAQLTAGELALQSQVDELGAALSERATFYEDQRNQANTQLQINIQQLKVQLDEANAKLADAQAQLGQ
jgi:hypothetical protein